MRYYHKKIDGRPHAHQPIPFPPLFLNLKSDNNTNTTTMGRLPRRRLRRGIYHVYNRSANKKWILEEDELKQRFLNLLIHFAELYTVNIYHYCIMNNHFHLAIEGDISEISKFVSSLCSRYSRYYHEQTDSGGGPIWQGRYKSILVQKEGYLSRLGRYIELNPVRAKMIDPIALANYPWCSARNYIKGISDGIIRPLDHPFNRQQDEYSIESQKVYAEYLRIPYDDDLILFRSDKKQIGDEGFLSSVIHTIGDRVKLSIGRPRTRKK